MCTVLVQVISSAVAFNQLRALQLTQKIVPVMSTESVLLGNLVDVATNRLSGNEKTQKAAQSLLETIVAECDKVTLLPLFSNRAMKNATGRAFLLTAIVDMSRHLQDKRPNYVVKYVDHYNCDNFASFMWYYPVRMLHI